MVVSIFFNTASLIYAQMPRWWEAYQTFGTVDPSKARCKAGPVIFFLFFPPQKLAYIIDTLKF